MIELPGYTIEKQLGRGGMARVYLARHTGLDRLIAIKVLSKDLDGDKSFSDRFMREARIVANLTHQNIITVHDAGVHNEFHYIAMEYLPGETLDDKIKRKLDIKQALSITRQIASTLDFAHKKNIVHRDVNPDNILFREDSAAVLTDFGIARATKSETRMTATDTVIGTPHYMSPEQAQGQEDLRRNEQEREQARRLALQKQKKAEAEALKAKRELQALKKKQLAQQNRKPAGPVSRPVIKPLKTAKTRPPEAEKPVVRQAEKKRRERKKPDSSPAG